MTSEPHLPERTRRGEERRVAVGALNAAHPVDGGIQRYGVAVLDEILAREPAAYGYVASESLAARHPGRVVSVGTTAMAHGTFVGNALRLAWHQTALPRRLLKDGASVYYSTVPDGMLSPPCAQVVTIHDLIPLRFPGSSPRLRHFFQRVVPRIVQVSSAVVTMSEATRRDLVDLFGVDEGRVHVVHQGYRRDVFRPAQTEESSRTREELGVGRYLLAVGEGRPYKNIPRLLEAFARLRPQGVTLVLAGRAHHREVDLPALARQLDIEPDVRFLGYVSDELLARLYGAAEAFVFPSLYEGFGIPPLEAMACGCPVVASDRAAIPEVCGDAALYVDPERVDSLVDQIEHILTDGELRARLRAAGLDRAQGFSYGSAAERILRVLRVCCGVGEGEPW